jgi:hypothetical protein
MSIDIIRTIVNDVKINIICITKNKPEDIFYEVQIDPLHIDETDLKKKIQNSLSFLNLDMNGTKCCNGTYVSGTICNNKEVKVPKLHNNTLESKDIKLANFINICGDTIYFRGLFDLTLTLTAERDVDKTKILTYTVEYINIGSDKMRYIGDCVFPDQFVDIGEDSVTYEHLYEFIRTY